ncbi:MAG: DUF2334 domain-containing protein [Clostridiales bacterium]|nr:DUF2334 domain-containing protein [Clostridiales bacterium]
MKKLSKRLKINLITDILLVLIFTAVYSVCFIPENIMPIYSGSGITAIYNGNRQNKKISLMFNVYENSEVVNGIIDVLEEKKVAATFFVGGCWADDNGQTLNRIVSSGNEIANHGYFHKDHKTLSAEKNREEILLTGKIIEALAGVQPTLFAPPSGSFSDTTLTVASNLGYKVIMWSKDTIDWRDGDENLIFNRATKDVTNGDLILMHPKPHTLRVLPRIIDYCLSVGLEIVTVSENLV